MVAEKRAGIEEHRGGGPLRLGWAGLGSIAAGVSHIHTHTVRTVLLCASPLCLCAAAVPAPCLLPDIQRYHIFNANGMGQHRLRNGSDCVYMCDCDSNSDRDSCVCMCVCVCADTMSTLRSVYTWTAGEQCCLTRQSEPTRSKDGNTDWHDRHSLPLSYQQPSLMH